MDGSQQALNEAGATPTPAFTEYGDGLVSTTEYSAPQSSGGEQAGADDSPDGGAKSADQQPAKTADNGQDASGAAGEDDMSSDKKGRLDRDSRFAQVIRSNKELKQQLTDLTQQLADLRSGSGPKGKDRSGDGKIFGMNPDELLDLQATDPAKYHQLFLDDVIKQVTDTVNSTVNETSDRRNYEDAIATTYETYAKDHPDFDAMWDSGEITEFLERHPGHNALSAHLTLTQDKRIQEAVDKAIKDTTEKIKADLRTKGKSVVLGQGPSGVVSHSEASDQELKDPKKFGGATAVLARRSAARRRI